MGVHVKVGGTWREVTEVAVKQGNTWRREAVVHVKSGGTWRSCGPIYQRTDTWDASWSQTYQGSNAKRDDANGNSYIYHGNSAIWGYLKGAFGFDYADIQATLAGRTIDSVTLRLYNIHFYNPTGIVRIGGHAHSSEPVTFSPVYQWDDATRGYESAALTRGTRNTLTLPDAVGDAFRDDAIRGLFLGFSSGSTSTTYYGYAAGSTHPAGDVPQLSITHSP